MQVTVTNMTALIFLIAAVVVCVTDADKVKFDNVYGLVKTNYKNLLAEYVKTLKVPSDGKTKTAPSETSVNKEICDDPEAGTEKHKTLMASVANMIADKLDNAKEMIMASDRDDEYQVLNDFALAAIVGEACGMPTNAVRYLNERGRHICLSALSYKTKHYGDTLQLKPKSEKQK